MNFSGDEMPFPHGNEFWFVRSNPVPIARNDQNQLRTPNWQELPRFPHGYVQDMSNYNRLAQNFIPVEQGYYGHNMMINHMTGTYMQNFEETAGWAHGGSASLLAMQNALSANIPANCLEMRFAASENLLAMRNANIRNIVNGTHYTNFGQVIHPQVQNLHFQASDRIIPNTHSQVGDWRQVNSVRRCSITNAPGSSAFILQDRMPNNGFPVPYNLNLPPPEVYADSNANSAFQLTEVQMANMESSRFSAMLNSPEILRRERGKQVMTCTENDVHIEQNCDELLQNLVDSSSAVVLNLVEDKGCSEGETDQLIDLNKTPQQKTPKRRKHRPKVIIEGKPKRARKPDSTKESKNPAVKSCRRALNFDSEIIGDGIQDQRRNGGALNLNSKSQGTELRIGQNNCRENSMSQMLAESASVKRSHIHNSEVISNHRDAKNANPCQNSRADRYTVIRQNIQAEGIGDIVLQARKICENPDGARQLMLRNSNSTPQITSSPGEIRGSKREHCHTFNQLQPNTTDGLRMLKKKKTENATHSIPQQGTT